MEHKPVPREDVYFVLTSLFHVVVVVLFGVLVNIDQLSYILPLVAFAVTSKVFALVSGENQRLFVHSRWAALPLAVLSLAILLFLPAVEMFLGVVVMLLYLCYPNVIRARERSPLDVLFHGTRYALLFWMGYYGGLNALSAIALTMVFLFGVTGELLVGLRNVQGWRTTASRLGKVRTVRVVNILVPVLIVLGSLIFSLEVDFPLRVGSFSIPVPFLAGLAIAAFLTHPVSVDKSHHAPISVRKRGIIALGLCLLVLVGVPLGTRVNVSGSVPGQNYVVNVGMQTIVTGPHTYDGQWIIFNYSDKGDFYYILLHTDGTLELGRFVDGVAEAEVQNVSTSYSPFQWHDYRIEVVNDIATVSIDGNVLMKSPVLDPGGMAMVNQNFPRSNVWVVAVTSFNVSAVGQ